MNHDTTMYEHRCGVCLVLATRTMELLMSASCARTTIISHDWRCFIKARILLEAISVTTRNIAYASSDLFKTINQSRTWPGYHECRRIWADIDDQKTSYERSSLGASERGSYKVFQMEYLHDGEMVVGPRWEAWNGISSGGWDYVKKGMLGWNYIACWYGVNVTLVGMWFLKVSIIEWFVVSDECRGSRRRMKI